MAADWAAAPICTAPDKPPPSGDSLADIFCFFAFYLALTVPRDYLERLDLRGIV